VFAVNLQGLALPTAIGSQAHGFFARVNFAYRLLTVALFEAAVRGLRGPVESASLADITLGGNK
jgi:hypothetical protein